MSKWIETKIENTFTTKNAVEMVAFSAPRSGKQSWAAPKWLVNRDLDNGWSQGLTVRIQIENEKISNVQRVGGVGPTAHKPTQGTNQHPNKPSSANQLPYGFVPFNPQGVVSDEPVWHDGSSGDELLSGEILCSMKALTPLLAGNARYQIRKGGEADGEQQVDLAHLKQWEFADLKPGKQIAEPLRLKDGRVVIAGSALKGMIRHSLGALLSAPMERVAERHYSYRPNLDFNQGAKEKYVTRPALVVASQNGGWTVEVFDNARAALFVRGNAEDIVRSAASSDGISGTIQGIDKSANRLTKQNDSSVHLNHRLAEYKGGIDGQGLLAGAFTPPTKTYRLALVPKTSVVTLEITAELYQSYLEDQKHVLANKKEGHLTAHPLHNLDVDRAAREIERNSPLSINQLIYVELKTESDKVTANSEIVSFGHHFRYRWAYTSSVREKGGQVRDCLAPTASEQTLDGEGKPQMLTGARLVFGYVRSDDTPIGKDDYERLAGRIAFNHAVSQHNPSFLGDERKGYCVPLRILGQPKSSAWEFYLQQPNEGAPATYGDLPGDSGGELAGRKFYWHQPSVQTEADIKATDAETINSDQATLARFICKPQTTFKFAIRFSQLRLWELGALLVALEPHRLIKNGQQGQYAHKLGLGRPLGMGSVGIKIDKLLVRKTGETQLSSQPLEGGELVDQALGKMRGKLITGGEMPDGQNFWLELHQYQNGKKRSYPQDNKGNVFGWHTEVRREYSKLRRLESPDCNAIQDKIKRHLG